MSNFTMTVGGRAATAGGFEVVDPATDEVVGVAPDCTPEQLDEAMASSVGAFPGWRSDPVARSEALSRAADVIEAAAVELAGLLTSEQGKPLPDSRIEVAGAVARFRYASTLTLDDEVLQDDDVATVTLERRPVGTVAAIVPWNAPLVIGMAKIAPALAAGNTVVLKPSPHTPLSTLRVGELLRAVLPAGVLNIVSGRDAELGEAIVRHPAPRLVDFTGSTGTGQRVAAAAAPGVKRIILELGGNDPAILLDDVDVDSVAERIFWCAFANCGQVCVAIKRLYVPQSLYTDVVSALAHIAASVLVGPGAEPGVQIGPLNNPLQAAHVSRLVTDAIARGAKAPAGGGYLDRPGNFFAPTIVSEVSDGTAVVDDEQFGPVLPVVAYESVDDAVVRANHTHFGLGGSVWATDVERAADVARRLECGACWVNNHRVLAAHLPFAGRKSSGFGTNSGTEGFHQFTEPQVVWRQKSCPSANPSKQTSGGSQRAK